MQLNDDKDGFMPNVWLPSIISARLLVACQTHWMFIINSGCIVDVLWTNAQCCHFRGSIDQNQKFKRIFFNINYNLEKKDHKFVRTLFLIVKLLQITDFCVS